ncbi:HIT family protein [Candidatus Nitrosotenuis cloacae]|uniref:HIT family protein n=1 Tax=Candidatus Nitrosotenuis cloacae TaxID=1603555 RepID=UPI0022830418|nr:HIT family protein [Candidatus Nitrosotenuis cloacae]
MDCIFCKIAKGEIKTRIVAETKKSLAFLDAFPLAPGHTLVIPKTHCAKIQDLSKEDNCDLFDLVHDVASKVDSLTGAVLLAVHNGKGAGQEIPHVHVHLVPRTEGDSAGAIHGMFAKRPAMSDSDFDKVLEKIK